MELKAERITRQYHRQGRGTNVFTAVRETDLILPAGKLIEVEGRSGSGKSTLLNMMAGLLQPTAGRVLLDGQDLYSMPDAALSRLRSRALGVIPQVQTGLSSLTVLENVLLPTMLYGTGEAGNPVRDRASALLESVGIAHLQNVWPDELSGGEMRRLAIARALIMDPGVVLADEPTADLDDENTKLVLSLLRRCADEGRAVLLVTHEREAASYADEVYRMSDGALALQPA